MSFNRVEVILDYQFLDGELVVVSATNGHKGIDYTDGLKDVTLEDILKDFK